MIDDNKKAYSMLHYENRKLIFTDLLDKKSLEFVIDNKLKTSRQSGINTYEKRKIKFTNGKFEQKINKDYYIIIYDDNGKKWKDGFNSFFSADVVNYTKGLK